LAGGILRRVKRSSARVEPLFTAVERAGLATLVSLLFALGLVCMTLPEMNSGSAEESWLARLYTYWKQVAGIFADAAELFTGLMWVGIFVGLWVDTFRRLRHAPLVVSRNVAWFAGGLLAVVLLNARNEIGDLAEAVLAPGLWDGWHAYFGSVVSLSERFLRLAIAVVIVVFGGELSQMARERMLLAEWVAAQNKPEEEQQSGRRREALILAVRGPKMPVTRAIGGVLALVAAPFAVAIGITRMAEEVDYFGRRLPPPPMTMVGPASADPQRQGSRLRIDATGRVYLDGAMAAQPRDEACTKLVGLLKQKAAHREEAVVLEIAPEVKYQRLIDVLSAAARAGVRVTIEE
jgi:hypothetical protein